MQYSNNGSNISDNSNSNGSQRPVWMEDPLVREISERKLRFLEELFEKGQGKGQKEVMAFMMPMLKKAKQENLTFTPQEVNAAISAIKKHSSAEELKKIDKILEKAKTADGKAADRK